MDLKNKTGLDPVFIVSTGRCGSTMIAWVLALHPSLCVLNSPQPPLRTEAFIKWSDRRRSGEVEKQVKEKRGKLISKIRRNRFIYVESSTSASLLIEELSAIFNARFVHICRDGRDFVRSGMERDWYKPEPFVYRLKTMLRRRFFMDTGRSTVDSMLRPPKELKTRFERIAWRWAEINKYIARSFESLPEESKFFLRIEDLDRAALVRLHQFIGVPVYDELLEEMMEVAGSRPNKTRHFSFPPPSEWTEWQRSRFRDIAGDVMVRLGYKV